MLLLLLHLHDISTYQFYISLSIAALKMYHEINNALPQRIVIYRDGVGDGQLAAVVEHELPQILDTVKALGSDYE